MQNLKMQDWCPLGSVGQATAANKMYVTLRGEVEIRSLGFKQRSVTWDSFGAGRANQSYLLYLPSYARNVTYTSVVRKPRRTNSTIWNG